MVEAESAHDPGRIEIPSKEEVTAEAKALCLKLILFPEKFTVLELAKLQEIMRNEGYLE